MRNKITRLLIILPIALFFVPFVSSCANGEVYIDVSNTCLYCNDISNNQTTVKFHNLSQKSKPALIQDQYGIDSNDRNSKITNNDNFNFSITKDSITFKYIKPFSEEDVKWSFKIDTNKRLFSLTLDLISTNKKTDKEIFDWIDRRTYSISCNNCIATGWLLNKVSDTNSYEYYIATNMHAAIHWVDPLGMKWSKSEQLNTPATGYSFFSSVENIDDNFTNFTFNNKSVKNGGNAIDFSVFKVNFGEYIPDPEKNNLDYLNSNVFDKQEHNYFYDGYITPSSKSPFYVLGYPVIYDSPIKTSAKITRVFNNVYYNGRSKYHEISSGTKKIYDYSSGYCAYNDSKTSMVGGCSGSMVVNENFEIVGILWGSEAYTNNPQFNAFDCFNDNISYNKSFISDYF